MSSLTRSLQSSHGPHKDRQTHTLTHTHPAGRMRSPMIPRRRRIVDEGLWQSERASLLRSAATDYFLRDSSETSKSLSTLEMVHSVKCLRSDYWRGLWFRRSRCSTVAAKKCFWKPGKCCMSTLLSRKSVDIVRVGKRRGVISEKQFTESYMLWRV